VQAVWLEPQVSVSLLPRTGAIDQDPLILAASLFEQDVGREIIELRSGALMSRQIPSRR
jgi:hypothetical protein